VRELLSCLSTEKRMITERVGRNHRAPKSDERKGPFIWREWKKKSEILLRDADPGEEDGKLQLRRGGVWRTKHQTNEKAGELAENQKGTEG